MPVWNFIYRIPQILCETALHCNYSIVIGCIDSKNCHNSSPCWDRYFYDSFICCFSRLILLVFYVLLWILLPLLFHFCQLMHKPLKILMSISFFFVSERITISIFRSKNFKVTSFCLFLIPCVFYTPIFKSLSFAASVYYFHLTYEAYLYWAF